MGPTESVFRRPAHPYAEALLSAHLDPDPAKARRLRPPRDLLKGEIPSPIDLPKGCYLSSRCGYAVDACRSTPQELSTLADQHLAALKDLIDHYADPSTPYLSHRHPVKGRIGDFDALARVAEWSATGGQDDEDDSAEGDDA